MMLVPPVIKTYTRLEVLAPLALTFQCLSDEPHHTTNNKGQAPSPKDEFTGHPRVSTWKAVGDEDIMLNLSKIVNINVFAVATFAREMIAIG
jgi:hypothetical protein